VICEIEPLIPPASTRYFAAENYNVMNDKRTEIVYDDARHFVARRTEIRRHHVRSDSPLRQGQRHPYSKEYFELVKAHLNPAASSANGCLSTRATPRP